MSTHFLETVPPNDWRERAACIGHDPEWWFAQGPDAPDLTATAINICNQCPVRRDCLDFAIDNRIDHGLYGGRTPEERDKIKRRRRAWRWGRGQA